MKRIKTELASFSPKFLITSVEIETIKKEKII